jgi:hypothetical protein
MNPNEQTAENVVSSTDSIEDFPTKIFNMNVEWSQLRNEKPTLLPSGYSPTALDVCCGRGKTNWNHEGNVAFRNLIRKYVPRYMGESSRADKTLIVVTIVDEIRSCGGRFLKEDDEGTWYDIGDAQARDKVGHSLRDHVTNMSKQKDSNDKTEARRISSPQSDSGQQIATRRSSLSSSSIIDQFASRRSFIANLGYFPRDLEPTPLAPGSTIESVEARRSWNVSHILDESMADISEGFDASDIAPLQLSSNDFGSLDVLFDDDQLRKLSYL